MYLEVAADLTRHQKAVNVVRWAPSGEVLASGDDESIIFIWKQKNEEPAPNIENGEEVYKESWVIHKVRVSGKLLKMYRVLIFSYNLLSQIFIHFLHLDCIARCDVGKVNKLPFT